jgi:hypothetical protein
MRQTIRELDALAIYVDDVVIQLTGRDRSDNGPVVADPRF